MKGIHAETSRPAYVDLHLSRVMLSNGLVLVVNVVTLKLIQHTTEFEDNANIQIYADLELHVQVEKFEMERCPQQEMQHSAILSMPECP